jgi:MFS family permease
MLLLIAAEIVCSFESSMVYVVLAHVYRETGDPVHAGWLLTAFTLTSASSAAVCSRLGDMFGRKKVLVIMLGVAATGSGISAIASDLNVIILGRALQGASMAILPLAFGLLRENAPADKVPLGVGILGGVYTFGNGIGTLMAGLIVDNFHWQSIFILSAGLALLAISSSALMLPGPRTPLVPGRIDVLGGVLFAPAVALLLLGFTFLNGGAWHDPEVFGCILGGLALLGIWTWHELRTSEPLISVRLLFDRRIALPNLAMFVFALGPMTLPLVFLPLLQQASWSGVGFDVSASVAGSIWLALCLFSSGMVIAGGHLATRHGSRKIVLASLVAMALGFVALWLGGYRSICAWDLRRFPESRCGCRLWDDTRAHHRTFTPGSYQRGDGTDAGHPLCLHVDRCAVRSLDTVDIDGHRARRSPAARPFRLSPVIPGSCCSGCHSRLLHRPDAGEASLETGSSRRSRKQRRKRAVAPGPPA